MHTVLKTLLFAAILPLLAFSQSVSIEIESQTDYAILDQFFRISLFEEEYGYVLEGKKPVSIRNYYSLHDFPISKDRAYSETEFTRSLLTEEAILVWNRLCSHQKNFALKAIPLKNNKAREFAWEVQFTNLTTLKEAIQSNINLFRYALGPTIDTETLAHRIAFSEEPLDEILHHDLVLTGIILGFGTQNSLIGGRIEAMLSQILTRDCAPYLPKSLLMHSKKQHRLHFYTPECFGGYYLEFAGGSDLPSEPRYSFLLPSSHDANLEEELLSLDAKQEPIPPTLYEKPAFVFGAFNIDGSNQPFFTTLQHTQKKIANLLQAPNFLEQVLEKIGGKKPHVTCTKALHLKNTEPFFCHHRTPQQWAVILKEQSTHFQTQKEQSAFFEAFLHPTPSFRKAPKIMGCSQNLLTGLKKALQNLSEAQAYFEVLSTNTLMQEVVKKQLYFSIPSPGSGQTLQEESRVRIGYVIEDQKGNILFANHDTWLDLSQTIPGFAHGIKGMRIGEQRQIYIHPALAYGSLTTLPPCSGLIAKVVLIDIDARFFCKIPSLEPLDFTWFQDPLYCKAIEESIEQLPRFLGSFYRDMLEKIPGLEIQKVISSLRN